MPVGWEGKMGTGKGKNEIQSMGKPSGNREAVRKEEGSKGDDEDQRAPQRLYYFFYSGRHPGLRSL